MSEIAKKINELVSNELRVIWTAHRNVGLSGYMCLYTNDNQEPFRTRPAEAGITFWFGENDTQAVIDKILELYNNGRLPSTQLLLNPIVHRKEEDDSYTPLGSGIIWCTALSLGIDVLSDLPAERLNNIGVFVSNFVRGGNDRAGIKALGFCSTIQPAKEDGKSVTGCKEIYDITDMKSEKYTTSYLLSGVAYLTVNGIFTHPDIQNLFPKNINPDEEFIKKYTISSQAILDAAKCWEAYERHHSLYQKFGINPDNIEKNLRFFNMVARDIAFFDATGPAKKGNGDSGSDFEFIVPGLIAKGTVTLLVAAGGTGRSALVHKLCALASMDYPEGAEPPKWLGQPLDIKNCQGINIYFAGEDSPQIFNARAEIIDPESLALRLMFQRTDFGENVSFAQHMRNLRKIPDVPLMIIDPARKYLGGDEGDNNLANIFFDALEDFAVQKNTAVVVVHQLQRGSNPKSTNEIIDLMSGSQAFIDRPRVIIGIYRDGVYTVAGLAKNNIPPNLGMISEERVFARDPKTLSLVWLPGENGVRNIDLSAAEIEAIAKKS